MLKRDTYLKNGRIFPIALTVCFWILVIVAMASLLPLWAFVGDNTFDKLENAFFTLATLGFSAFVGVTYMFDLSSIRDKSKRDKAYDTLLEMRVLAILIYLVVMMVYMPLSIYGIPMVRCSIMLALAMSYFFLMTHLEKIMYRIKQSDSAPAEDHLKILTSEVQSLKEELVKTKKEILSQQQAIQTPQQQSLSPYRLKKQRRTGRKR